MTPHGCVSRIVDLWEQGVIDLLISEVIPSEYVRVLHYPRLRPVHRLTDSQLTEIEESFREFTELVEPHETPAYAVSHPSE